MPLFRRRKPDQETRQFGPEPIVPPFPGANASGITRPDNPNAALQVPAVWACVRLKADAISSMPLNSYRTAPDGSPLEIPPAGLLENPSATRSLPEWLFDYVVSSELRGNTFGQIVAFDADDRPTQIELVDPDAVRLSYDDQRRLVYKFYGVTVPSENVWHTRGYSFPGSPLGLSAITYGACAIGLAAYAEDFGRRFFADGAHPSSILASDQGVDQEQAMAIKDRFRIAASGREPVVLGLGVSYQPIQISPDEAQFLATQQWSVNQIARLFGVPATMVGGTMGDGMVYANVEQRSLDFLTYAVQPLLRRIEVAISALMPPGEFVRFDVSSLLRTDAETSVKVQAIQLASRTRTITELRQHDGLPPLTDAQLKELELVPLLITPMGGVKEKPSPSGAGPADEVVPSSGTALRGEPLHLNLVVNVPERGVDLRMPDVNIHAPIAVHTPEHRVENFIEHHTHTAIAAPGPVVVPAPLVEFHEGRTTIHAPITVEAPPKPELRELVKSVERDVAGNIVRIREEVG